MRLSRDVLSLRQLEEDFLTHSRPCAVRLEVSEWTPGGGEAEEEKGMLIERGPFVGDSFT